MAKSKSQEKREEFMATIQEYMFPKYGITILASSMQDALEKLELTGLTKEKN